MKLKKLLPCPFCGDSAPDIFQAGPNLLWYITCQDTDCMCSFNSIRRENVIAAWNTRTKASAASTPPEGKVLEQAHEVCPRCKGGKQLWNGKDRPLLWCPDCDGLGYKFPALAAPAPAPVCVCGHSKADHAEKHGWECSEECTCLKYTPAPACKTCDYLDFNGNHPADCPDCNAGEGEK